MSEQHADFQYRALIEIPKEIRQVDWTHVSVHDKPFSEGEQAFHRLRDELRHVFSDKPFAYLNFLRAIEDHLINLAVDTRQPISKCLEYLRRRLDLEYGRGDIYSKAAKLVVIAKYAVECGEIELARKLLEEERKQLEETAETCQGWLETITQRIDELTA